MAVHQFPYVDRRFARDAPRRGRLIVAIIAAVIAAVIGFFGVRIIADLATDDAAAAVPSVTTSQG